MIVFALALVTLGVAFGKVQAAEAGSEPSRPRSPTEAQALFQLADSQLQIELVAAEPDVIDPVAIAWDADERLYVVEMHDYPTGPPDGRVKLLVDNDGDGRYERVTVFADGLAFPNGVLPWQGGVLVTAAPNIWFFEDTDGDGRADERRVVLSGFGEGNQQLRVNGLLWGLDNWVYGANGRSDGALRRPDAAPQQAVSIRRRDFRFQPRTGPIEAIAGASQFGLARDDWGNRFLSWNTVPMRHAVIENRYLERNPGLAARSGIATIVDPTDSNRLFPISPPPRTFNRESVQTFNASCGLSIYRGDALPEAYRGNALVCEPLLNLVHRRVLRRDGPTFVAERGEQGKEFLASQDPWFRPVNLATAPDGALHVVDFYRKWVEHPQFVAASLRAGVDFRAGDDRGRIWRIVRRRSSDRLAEQPSTVGTPRTAQLSKAGVDEVVRALDDPNGWRRDTAQRLLVERHDPTVVARIKASLAQVHGAVGAIHALWTLAGLDALDDQVLLASLADNRATVREQALKLAEGKLAASPALRTAALKLTDDPAPRVRFQLALICGGLPAEEAVAALARLADQDAANPWHRLAILSAVGEGAAPLLVHLFRSDEAWRRSPTPEQAETLSTLAAMVASHHDKARRTAQLTESLALLMSTGSATAADLAIVLGTAEGLSRAGERLRHVLADPAAGLAVAVPRIRAVLDAAASTALSIDEPEANRLLAVRLLAHCDATFAGPPLLELLEPRHARAVQLASARAIGQMDDAELASRMLAGWDAYAVATRREVLAACCRSSRLALPLVAALEEERIALAELDSVTRDALGQLGEPALKARIVRLLASITNASREAVLGDYQAALRLAGDRARGGVLFTQNCLACHAIQGVGARVGPELSGIGSRPRETLLVDILDPNHDVAPDFVNYTLATSDGQVFGGLLVAETDASVTLRRAEGADDTVPRERIERLQSSGKSLMPEGFEQKLRPDDVADLLIFLAQPDRNLLSK